MHIKGIQSYFCNTPIATMHRFKNLYKPSELKVYFSSWKANQYPSAFPFLVAAHGGPNRVNIQPGTNLSRMFTEFEKAQL